MIFCDFDNFAFFGNKYFILEDYFVWGDGFWDFIDNALSKGKYVFLYLSYEAGSPKKFMPPYPIAVVWEASVVSKKVFNMWLSKESFSCDDFYLYDVRALKDYKSYVSGFNFIKNQLSEGNSYQVNYTFPIVFKYNGNWKNIVLRSLNSQKTKYSAFFKFGKLAFVSCSPEMFFRVEKNSIVCEPMKGTWDKFKEPYLNEKISAENLMIVDLIRNDLGRICKSGSIKANLFKIVELPSLWQMVSVVKGKLKEGVSYKEMFESLFPCGSITGAPKIYTQIIISEAEDYYRGIYTGAIGYISPKKKALFNVAIRTVEIDTESKTGRLSVGGGIVWDSNPCDEYNKALSKARFFIDTFIDFKLIETMRVENGKVRFLNLHISRLMKSANFFGFNANENSIVKEILDAIEKKVADSGVYKLRLLLDFYGNVEISIDKFINEDKIYRVCLFPQPVNSNNIFLFHKTTKRDLFNDALNYAKKKNCDEAIFFNENGFVTQGAFTNVFIAKNNHLLTPPVSHGL